MKKEDFDEMKAFCNKKGLELLNVDHEDNEKYEWLKVGERNLMVRDKK